MGARLGFGSAPPGVSLRAELKGRKVKLCNSISIKGEEKRKL